jgi:hypothetical protein
MEQQSGSVRIERVIMGARALASIDGATVEISLPQWSGRQNRQQALDYLRALGRFVTEVRTVLAGMEAEAHMFSVLGLPDPVDALNEIARRIASEGPLPPSLDDVALARLQAREREGR